MFEWILLAVWVFGWNLILIEAVMRLEKRIQKLEKGMKVNES